MNRSGLNSAESSPQCNAIKEKKIALNINRISKGRASYLTVHIGPINVHDNNASVWYVDSILLGFAMLAWSVCMRGESSSCDCCVCVDVFG